MRLIRTVIPVVLLALAALAIPAVAKEGVRAKAINTVRMDTAPGKTMRVTFRLVDAEGGTFGAGGIYLKIFRCGRPSVTVPAKEDGNRYTANFTVPKGRMRKLVVGLQGWRTAAGAKPVRADVFFPFAPPLVRRCG